VGAGSGDAVWTTVIPAHVEPNSLCLGELSPRWWTELAVGSTGHAFIAIIDEPRDDHCRGGLATLSLHELDSRGTDPDILALDSGGEVSIFGADNISIFGTRHYLLTGVLQYTYNAMYLIRSSTVSRMYDYDVAWGSGTYADATGDAAGDVFIHVSHSVDLVTDCESLESA
jgi:hypothetical protein